jgi:hypothetical protein
MALKRAEEPLRSEIASTLRGLNGQRVVKEASR